MPRRKKIKTIIDTNLFISFLIGKRLSGLKAYLVDSNVELVFSEQNITELKLVTCRKKFRKYFPSSEVDDLVDFIRLIGKVFDIQNILEICRDPKDDFLLALSKKSKADYLVTGDSDLLDLRVYKDTKIITIVEFESILETGTKG